MYAKKVLFCVAFFVLIAGVSHAQSWSGILSPTSGAGACTLAPALGPGAAAACAIDWTQTGIPGGVPSGSWTQSGTTIQASTYGNGSIDATSGIQAALNVCGANKFVLLGAGTFRINSSLSVPSNCALRGAGANQTILNAFGSSQAVVNLGSGSVAFGGPSITAGATAGSTSITVSSASGITVGSYLIVTETNASWVSIHGGEGDCTWCDGWSTNGNRARGQIVEVTSVSGTAIGFTPALYTAYTNSPVATPFTASAKYAGVENLQVHSNNTGYGDSFYMSECAYCWIQGVESNYADGDFVEVDWGYRDEIRDSYFSNAYTHAPGSHDSDVFIVYKTSASLVENNIIERAHVSILLNWGAAGNVIAYNYTEGEFDAGSTNFVIGGIGMHGAHPQFNLIEGNVMDEFYPDQVWGSSSHNTLFRNWAEGTTRACSPTSGTGTVNCSGSSGWWTYQASRAMQIAHLSLYFNFVGDVSGSANQNNLLASGSATSHVAILAFPGARSYDTTNYNFSFGYGESGDGGTGNGCSGATVTPCNGTGPYNTALLYKDYTFANGTTNCISGGSAGTCNLSLPASFYRTSKPAWWGSTLPWPAIGPDVSGGTGAGGHTSLTASNPAQNCYLSVMGGTEGGAGSPLTFNASNCYASSQQTKPPPPTGITAQVR